MCDATMITKIIEECEWNQMKSISAVTKVIILKGMEFSIYLLPDLSLKHGSD